MPTNNNLSHETPFIERIAWMSRFANFMDKAWLFFVFTSALIVAYISFADSSPGILLMLIAGIAVGLIISRLNRKDKSEKIALFRVYVVVFCLSVTAACMMYSYSMASNGTPYRYGLEDDDIAYDTKALTIYQQANIFDVDTIRDDLRLMGSGTWKVGDNYTIMIAWLYRILDYCGYPPHPLYPRILNAMALALIALLVYGVSMRCGIPKTFARFSAYFCGLFPYMLFNSLQTYRDMLVSLGILAMVAGLTCMLVPPPSTFQQTYRLHSRIPFFLLFAFGCALAFNLRETYQLIFSLVITACIIVSQKRFSVSCILAIAFALIGVGVLLTGYGKLDSIITTNRLNQLEYYNTRNITGQGNITSAMFQMPYAMSIPFRILWRNIAPLPLPQANLFDNLERVGTVFWFLMLPTLLRGLGYSFRPKDWTNTRAVRIVACCFILFFLANVMTTLQDRHITTYIPAACIVATYYLFFGKNKISSDFKLTVFVGSFLILVYLVVHL